eukprot:PhF_6_TR44183/c0_g1_i1/m.67729/K18442/ARFGEF, BIG; brefeldin A-inhibited guanine nucleotide-exchange protein
MAEVGSTPLPRTSYDLNPNSTTPNPHFPFVLRCMEHIIPLCSSKKHYPLKDACIAVQNYISKGDRSVVPQPPPSDSGNVHRDEMNLIFVPLKLACENPQQRIVELSLDCLHKLIAYGFFVEGMAYNPPVIPQQPRAKPVFALFDRDDVPATPATRRSLTSIGGDNPKDLVTAVVDAICFHALCQQESVQLHVLRALSALVDNPVCGVHKMVLLHIVSTLFNILLQSRFPEVQNTANATLTQVLSCVFQRLETSVQKATPQNIVLTSHRSRGLTRVVSMVDDPCRVASDIVEEIVGLALAKTDQPKPETPISRTDSNLKASNRQDGVDWMNIDISGELPQEFSSIYHYDCFLIFRALCTLSTTKGMEHGEGPGTRSRVLSLNMIIHILSQSGPVLKSFVPFVNSVRQYVCDCLLENTTSATYDTFRASCFIFHALIMYFRHAMKKEILAFFTNVFFPILESSNASFQQKSVVIHILHKVCSDPQTILDIFVNFDCDVDCSNVFEQMVSHISKVVQASHIVPGWVTPRQEISMKIMAVQALVMILRSMVKWTSAFEDVATNDHESHVTPTEADGTVVTGHSDEIDEEDEFNRARRMKKENEKINEIFKQKPKSAIKQLQQQKILDKDPKVIAKWLLTTKSLCKVAIGTYLSNNDEETASVLREYVELFDFQRMHIDDALRLFMGTYKIAGEAQVVDRTMLSFAQKYYRDNKTGALSNADTAYVLAFSIMMLNTDAHNPAIKEKDKMTMAQFISMNAKIDDGQDLPRQLLEDVYKRVTTNEIKLEGASSEPVHPKNPTGNFKDRSVGFMHEARSMMLRTQDALKARNTSDSDSAFYSANKIDHVKPMFEVCWAPMLAAFSIMIESHDIETVTQLCLEGFERAVPIACLFYLKVEREAFMCGLAKLTNLTNFREITPKNVRAIRTLITIATVNSNVLQSSWYEVLKCISQLEKLHLIGSSKQDFAFLEVPSNVDGVPKRAGAIVQHFERLNAEVIAENIQTSSIDKIFVRATDLTGEAVVYFVECLCRVSREEVELTTPPRTFSLQKLIEVADANMSRIRLVWHQLWIHIGRHFINVGLHKQLSVSMYAVDSLRQLSVKFLAQDELRHFHFQRDFLKPFEVIYTQSRVVEVRELVVRCIGHIITARSHNIMSGWRTLLSCLTQCAADACDSVVSLAFDVLSYINDVCRPLLATPDTFVDFINFLIAMCFNKANRTISKKSLEILFDATVMLSKDKISGNGAGAGSDTDSPDGKNSPTSSLRKVQGDVDDVSVKVWFSILSGLSAITTSHPHIDVRMESLRTLFRILHAYTNSFTPEMWRLVFAGSIFPIFDNIFCDLDLEAQLSESVQDLEQLKTIEFALAYLLDLFLARFSCLRGHLGDVLSSICQCITKPIRSVSDMGILALEELVCSHLQGIVVPRTRPSGYIPIETGSDGCDDVSVFYHEEWEVFRNKITLLFDASTPLCLTSAGHNKKNNTLVHCAQGQTQSGVAPLAAQNANDSFMGSECSTTIMSPVTNASRLDIDDHKENDEETREAIEVHEGDEQPTVGNSNSSFTNESAPGTPIRVFMEKAAHSSSKRAVAGGRKPSLVSSEMWKQISIPLCLAQLQTTNALIQTLSSLCDRIVCYVEADVITTILTCFWAITHFTTIVLSSGVRLVDLELFSPHLLDLLLKVQKESVTSYITLTSRYFDGCALSMVLPTANSEARPDPQLSDIVETKLLAAVNVIVQRYLLIHKVIQSPQAYDSPETKYVVLHTMQEVLEYSSASPTSIARAAIAHDMWGRHLASLTPVVCLAITALGCFEKEEFQRHIPQHYDSLCQLLEITLDASITKAVTKVLRRIGKELLGWVPQA